jgi:hypothetical protein
VDDTTKKQARVAGALYLLMAVTAPLGLMYVPLQLFVPGDAALTAEHLREGESLLRLGMASELFHQALEVYLVLALVRLFKPVSRGLTGQMALLGLIPIPIMFLNVLNEVAALTLAQGPEFLGAFSQAQRDALALLFIGLHGTGQQVAAVFWGLWLFPLGLLVWRCGFIPRSIGVVVIAAGVGYLVNAGVSLLVPSLQPVIGDLPMILAVGEPVLILWLVVFGARVAPTPSLPAMAA